MDFKRVDDTVVDDKGWSKTDDPLGYKLWGCETGPTHDANRTCQEAVSKGNDHPISGSMLVSGRVIVFFPRNPRDWENYHEIHGGADCNLGVVRTPFDSVNGRNPIVVNVCTFACAA